MSTATAELPLSRRFRFGLRKYRAWVADAVLAIGLFLTALALGYFTPLASTQLFTAINNVTATPTANYNLLFVVLGPIITIAGAYLVGSYYTARRKFDHLMRTKSKAEFLRNIPEIEDLLWELTPKDEVLYEQKKVELRVRR
jgi:hypothetical protein